LFKVYGRGEQRYHQEANEEVKENLEIFLFNGSITKEQGWQPSSDTNILIVNHGGRDVIIDYFYIFAKDGSLWIKGMMDMTIEKGSRENLNPNKLGLPAYMNNWKNFEQYVGLIAFHTTNGNLFISKYEIPSIEEAPPPPH